MVWVAGVLLLAIAARHFGAASLAPMFGLPPQGMFHVLGGALEVVVCGVIGVLLLTQRPSRARRLAHSAVAVGMVEGAQIVGCRLAIPDLSLVPRGANLCDHVTGLPVSATVVSLYVVILCWGVCRK